MAIRNPILPPKAGYAEVEVGGRRTYRNVSTGILIENEVPAPTDGERIRVLEEENALLKAQVAAQSSQMDFYEECIVELAGIVYA